MTEKRLLAPAYPIRFGDPIGWGALGLLDALAAIGFCGGMDRTKAEVLDSSNSNILKVFQNSRGIPGDGTAYGPETQKALQAALDALPKPKYDAFQDENTVRSWGEVPLGEMNKWYDDYDANGKWLGIKKRRQPKPIVGWVETYCPGKRNQQPDYPTLVGYRWLFTDEKFPYNTVNDYLGSPWRALWEHGGTWLATNNFRGPSTAKLIRKPTKHIIGWVDEYAAWIERNIKSLKAIQKDLQ